jgi:hypothetical protein
MLRVAAGPVYHGACSELWPREARENRVANYEIGVGLSLRLRPNPTPYVGEARPATTDKANTSQVIFFIPTFVGVLCARHQSAANEVCRRTASAGSRAELVWTPCGR